MPFVTPAQIPAQPLFPGITAHYLHLARMTVSEVELLEGVLIPAHQHPHEQISYVLSGRFEFTVGTETRVMEPGACALIPGGVTHSGRTLTACRVLDVFSPVRDDYR